MKPGPSGDIYSENKGITTEVIKPTRQGDSSSNTDGISSASTSKQVNCNCCYFYATGLIIFVRERTVNISIHFETLVLSC